MGQENAPALGCVNEAVGNDRRRPLALDRGIPKPLQKDHRLTSRTEDLAPLTRRLCRCLGTKSPARRDGAWRFETLNRTSPAVSRLNYSNRRLENKCCLIKAHAITRDRTI